jgi:hypothetical protein
MGAGQDAFLYNAPMRSWLLAFLMVLMPLQLSWAVVGVCGPHQDSRRPLHCTPSDDSTRHHADARHGDITPTPDTILDADCGHCHAGTCLIGPISESTSLLHPAGTTRPASAILQDTSRPPDLPERPQW